MIRGIYTAVTGMVSEEAKQNVITNNLANMNTNGFKSDSLVYKDFKDVWIQNHQKTVNGRNEANVIGQLSLGSKIDETNTDFTQGDIQSTGQSTDFALNGKGFFTVDRDNGTTNQNYYTRDGHFHINIQGYLVTDNGDYVLGKNVANGNSERIYAGNGKLTCDSSGNISVNGKPAYTLQISDFNDYKTLQKVGDNLYAAANPIQAANYNVEQNALEKSNVNTVNQMVDMISTVRSFESAQKVVSTIDQTLSMAVNDVGKV